MTNAEKVKVIEMLVAELIADVGCSDGCPSCSVGVAIYACDKHDDDNHDHDESCGVPCLDAAFNAGYKAAKEE